MSVLNYGLSVSKYYFGLFCIFGRLVVSSVLKCGLFQNFWVFGRYLSCRLFQLASQRFNVLVAFRRPNIGKEQSLAFLIEFDRHSF